MSAHRPFTCPVCNGTDVALFFESKNVPAHCNVLHPTREAALAVRRGDLQLGFCRRCGHIYNYAFDAALITYTQQYDNSLHFSPRFQHYAGGLVNHLITRYDLHGKTVVEIGCGKGEFLKMMCETGENRGVGFDQSYQPSRDENRNERFVVIQDFYSGKYAHYTPDFLYCRHVLEHIQSPAAFVEGIHALMPPHCPAYFEVPNALYTLRNLGIWDLIYEHCSYFTPQSLVHLFTATGFDMTMVDEQYESQFLGIEVMRTGGISGVDSIGSSGSSPIAPTDMTTLARHVHSFAENYSNKKEAWTQHLHALRQKRVVVWGSGSKGVTFLNVMRPDVGYVVDVNPRKQGMFVAGTGQQIVAPEFLRAYQPDAVIIMNPIYEREIEKTLHQMDVRSLIVMA
jgi:hypothetical protein